MIAGQLVIDGLVTGLVFGILAVGLVFIAKVSKMLFMAYGIFYTVGAYATWYGVYYLHLPYFLALLVGALGSGLLGVLCYLVVLRRLVRAAGPRFFVASLIASIGLMLILNQASVLVFGTIQRSLPTIFAGTINWLGLHITLSKLILIFVSIAIAVILFWVYEKTAVGRSLRAVAFQQEIASLQGIDTSRMFMLALGIGTALAGISGGLLAPVYGMDPGMGNNVIWTVMLMMMLGGMGSLLGGLAGGLLIGQVLSFGQFYIGGTVQIIVFIFIGVVLYFRPNGLLGKGMDIGI